MRRALLLAVLAILATTGFATARSLAAAPASIAPAAASKTCSSSYVHAIIGGEEKCLRAGEFCSAAYESDYEKYGFFCVGGHLKSGTSEGTTTATTSTPSKPKLGRTVLLKHRIRKQGCRLGALPDRRCSPGAYYKGLTKKVICSSSFHTSTIRNVPQSEKYAVEQEYGLAPKLYGYTLEIDHIVSLELGGSNNIANLFPEEATFANDSPGYHVKDKLENKLHALVCSGQMSLRSAQLRIAGNWEQLYRKVYHREP